MPSIPRETSLDSTLALLSEGYTFIGRRCRRYRSDVFQTRLMLREATCTLGEEAARVFYQPDRFTRVGAVPLTTLKLLQDLGSVQTLDGESHRWRKQLFLALTAPERVSALAQVTADHWRAAVDTWERLERVVLLDAVQEVLCRAVCAWAGVPLAEAQVRRRTREFAAMIDGAGAVGPRNWWGLLLRRRTERWARRLIVGIRAGGLQVPEGSAAHAIAWHREPDGALLDAAVAAVELINVLRPTVAVAQYVTFAALALHEHPEHRRKLQDGDDAYLALFVQEVRRFYPFFPAVGGRVREPFDWRGHHFAAGSWVLLDLYGTNHDPRLWDEPDVFRPERFTTWDGSAFNLIPQGGGDYPTGHRCPGEGITIELLKVAVRSLTRSMRYEVPPQDLRVSLARMPAVPKSRFVISRVERVA